MPEVKNAHQIDFYQCEEGLVVKFAQAHKPVPIINGVNAQPLFLGGWYLVPGVAEIEKLEIDGGTRRINERWHLKNPAVACAPMFIAYEAWRQAGAWDEGEFMGMESLYSFTYETEPVGYIECAFTATNKGFLSFANIGNPTTFRYSLGPKRDRWDGDSKDAEALLTWENLYEQYEWSRLIHVSEIQKAFTPQIAWHLGPCAIGSETMYKIVRQYVKTHIDGAVAQVTSDYDFHFAVSRRIAVKPYETKSSYKRTPRSKPVMVTNSIAYITKPLFEMSHKGRPWEKAPVMQDFHGSSLENLAAEINGYLYALMEAINDPVVTCPTCDGCGIVNYFRIPTNERNQYALKPKQLTAGPEVGNGR